MLVKNLVSVAGPDYVCLPGEVIDLDDDTAKARIEAGLCEAMPVEQPKPQARKRPEDNKRND